MRNFGYLSGQCCGIRIASFCLVARFLRISGWLKADGGGWLAIALVLSWAFPADPVLSSSGKSFCAGVFVELTIEGLSIREHSRRKLGDAINGNLWAIHFAAEERSFRENNPNKPIPKTLEGAQERMEQASANLREAVREWMLLQTDVNFSTTEDGVIVFEIPSETSEINRNQFNQLLFLLGSIGTEVRFDQNRLDQHGILGAFAPHDLGWGQHSLLLNSADLLYLRPDMTLRHEAVHAYFRGSLLLSFQSPYVGWAKPQSKEGRFKKLLWFLKIYSKVFGTKSKERAFEESSLLLKNYSKRFSRDEPIAQAIGALIGFESALAHHAYIEAREGPSEIYVGHLLEIYSSLLRSDSMIKVLKQQVDSFDPHDQARVLQELTALEKAILDFFEQIKHYIGEVYQFENDHRNSKTPREEWRPFSSWRSPEEMREIVETQARLAAPIREALRPMLENYELLGDPATVAERQGILASLRELLLSESFDPISPVGPASGSSELDPVSSDSEGARAP